MPVSPILLVDADPDNRSVYRMYFERVGALEVKEAASGGEALTMLQESPRPSVIIFDLVLPDMDGFDLCEQMRASSGAAAEGADPPPLIALTGWPLYAAERARLHALGVSLALQKPCPPDKLLADIRALVAKSRELRAQSNATRARSVELQSQSGELLRKLARLARPKTRDRHSG